MASPVNAVTEIGVSCRFSSRCCAVITVSWMPLVTCAAGGSSPAGAAKAPCSGIDASMAAVSITRR